MRLEPRLQAVADLIQAPTHLDIGSDHAQLPCYLLETGRIQKALVVEKNLIPFQQAQTALKPYPADVRLGDGLGPVASREADSLSLCGLGARRMAQILAKHPERVPSKVVLQPNDAPTPLRVWALEHGFHLNREAMVQGFWRYTVLSFERAEGNDGAYRSVPKDLALHYGPLLLKRRDPLLLKELRHQQRLLSSLPDHPEVARKLERFQTALAYFE